MGENVSINTYFRNQKLQWVPQPFQKNIIDFSNNLHLFSLQSFEFSGVYSLIQVFPLLRKMDLKDHKASVTI